MAKTLAQKMEKMVGYCSSCGADIFTSTSGKRRPLPTYREHTIGLTDGTLMKVGVCSECKLSLVSGANVLKTAKKIIANHKIYWRKSKDKPAAFEDVDVDDPNTNYRRFKQARDHKENERKQHKN